MVENGLPPCGPSGALRYCAANTSVPSCIVMPRPGPCRTKRHFGSLTCSVMLTGSDHVRPSSSLCVSISWPVSSGSIPGPEPFQDRLPWLHVAATQIRPVSRSTSTAGSPTPSWFHFGSSPMSRITRDGDHVRPPSVLRDMPTSMSPGRSPELR